MSAHCVETLGSFFTKLVGLKLRVVLVDNRSMKINLALGLTYTIEH